MTNVSGLGRAPTFMDLLACDARLEVECARCEKTSVPILGKVALRVGLQSRMDDSVEIRCAYCGNPETTVSVRYPGVIPE